MYDECRDPKTRPSALLLFKLLVSVTVKETTVMNEVRKIQPSCRDSSCPLAGLRKMNIITLKSPSMVPLNNVNSESSGEQTSGDTLGALVDMFSRRGGFSHAREPTAEVEASVAGAEDLTADTFGLEDGKEGGYTKTESPSAR